MIKVSNFREWITKSDVAIECREKRPPVDIWTRCRWYRYFIQWDVEKTHMDRWGNDEHLTTLRIYGPYGPANISAVVPVANIHPRGWQLRELHDVPYIGTTEMKLYMTIDWRDGIVQFWMYDGQWRNGKAEVGLGGHYLSDEDRRTSDKFISWVQTAIEELAIYSNIIEIRNRKHNP